MNDETATNTDSAPVPEPTDEKPSQPTAAPDQAPAPEAEAAVEIETQPDPEDAPEPTPAPPPELVADETTGATHETPAPVEEPVSEEPAPVAVTTEEAATEEEPKAKKPRAKKPKKAETEEAPSATVTPDAPVAAEGENKKKWYAIKVQSGREDSIKAAIMRKVAIEGLEEFFGRIEIPFEEEIVKKSVKVKDKKTGESTYQEKKVTRKKKKFQGYLFAELEFNDRVLYLIRDTSGVGDFLNLRQRKDQLPLPEPMPDHEVQSMLTGVAVKDPNKQKKVKIDFEKGDKVRVREGSFANFEGEVKLISEPKDPTDVPKITLELTVLGRPLKVEFDATQVEKV